MEFKERYPLAQLTTFQIGGPASFFVEVTDLDEVKQSVYFANQKKLAVFVLGGGSNILISDAGINGLVIHNNIKQLQISDSGLLTIGAGEPWDGVVAAAVKHGLAGIECLSGVPGTAGGAVVQNIGAYGQTIGDCVVQVNAIEVATGEEKVFRKADCKFEYRNSWFKSNVGKYVVTEFQIQLNPNGLPNLSYPHVKKHFENHPNPTLEAVRDFVIKLRGSKGYLIMPGYECYQTAGSFFKNPVVTTEVFERLKSMLGEPEQNRYWPMALGVKIAAAFLLQEAGFGKGYREGNVGISPKHALSVVNFGNASAAEVKAFADRIKQTVWEKFGVRLEEEVLFV